jgi:hypothetical protein
MDGRQHWFWRYTDWLGRIWLWWTAVTAVLAGFLIEWWHRLQEYNPVSRALILGGFGILLLIAIAYFTRVAGSLVIQRRLREQQAQRATGHAVSHGGMAMQDAPGAQVHNNLFETHFHAPAQGPGQPPPEEPDEPDEPA